MSVCLVVLIPSEPANRPDSFFFPIPALMCAMMHSVWPALTI